MRRRRSAFGSIVRRRVGDGKVVPLDFRGATRPGYYVRIAVGGRDTWRKAGDTIDEATDFLAKVKRELHEHAVFGTVPIEDRPFKDVAEEYLRAVERTHSTTTYHDETNKLRNVLVPAFKDRSIASIGARDVQRFLEVRAAKVSIATRNRDLSLLSSVFRRAVKLGYCRENPARGFARPKEEARSFPYHDIAAQRRLVETCHESIRPFVALALETGLRQGELLRLEWSAVDLERRQLTVRVSKTKRPRTVPLTSAALDALCALQAARGAVPMAGPDRVFATLPERWAGHSHRLFVAATKAAKVPGLRFHDLRHLFASNLVRAGVPITDVAQLLGHATLAMSLRYANHAPHDAGSRAVDALERFKATAGTTTSNGAARSEAAA
jgi:integrase